MSDEKIADSVAEGLRWLEAVKTDTKAVFNRHELIFEGRDNKAMDASETETCLTRRTRSSTAASPSP